MMRPYGCGPNDLFCRQSYIDNRRLTIDCRFRKIEKFNMTRFKSGIGNWESENVTKPDSYVGQPLSRREDLRFLTGRGRYVDDLRMPDAAYAAFVRSPHANAEIRGIDSERA